MDKTVSSVEEAVADIGDGARLAVGGFGMVGVPIRLIQALNKLGSTNLETTSNNLGIKGEGLGLLLSAGQIRRSTASFVGDNTEFARRYLEGDIELELTPQGSLAERLRAGGSGIPAFYTPTGVGTLIAEGGLPIRYGADGSVVLASEPKEVRVFDGAEYVLERAITADFALVRAARGDRHGNLIFATSARNFNVVAAMAGRITIAEVEELVEPGELDPNDIQLPGIFVQRVVEVDSDGKLIEYPTTRPRPSEESS